MKVWANFFFRQKAQQLGELLYRLQPLASRLKAFCQLSYQMAAAMLAYVHAWHPRRYFIVYHRGNVTEIILREEVGGLSSQETTRTVKNIHEIDNVLKEMAQLNNAPLLYQASAVPVMVVTQGAECEMKAFDLTKVPFWKRGGVIRRVEENFIQADVARPRSLWLQKAYVRQSQSDMGGAQVVSKCVWFGVLKLSASLTILADWLHRQKRPVMAARWAPMMLSEYLWQSLDEASSWTVLLCQHDVDGFQLFVYHHRLLVLYRQGFVNSFTEGGLQEEVHQTMRYAERLGYMPSVGCRVVCYGFEPMPNMKAVPLVEWQWRQMPEQKDWLVNVGRRGASFLQKSTLDRVELSPSRFISSWMAYHLPRWICAVAVPLIHFAFWSFLVLWMKSSYLSHTMSAMEPFVIDQKSQQAQWSSRIAYAAGFETFLHVYGHHPMSLMHRVTPMLDSVGVVQRIRYDASKPNEHAISFYFPQRMSKTILSNMRKNLGEESFCVEPGVHGALQTLHVTQKY